MATFWSDNFSTYTAGPLPGPSFTITGWNNAGLFQSDIEASGGIQGGQYYQMFGEINRVDIPTGAVTIWFGLLPRVDGFIGASLLSLSNGTVTNSAVSVTNLRVEPDQTISIYCNGTFGGNTGTAVLDNANGFALHLGDWHFCQLNAAYTAHAGTGTDTNTYLKVDAELAINGTSMVQANVVTGIIVGNLPTANPDIAIYDWAGSFGLDNILAESIVPINQFPNPGTPNIRISQGVVEVAHNIDDPAGRVSQGVIEVTEQINTVAARISQGVIELLIIEQGGSWYMYEA